MPAHRFRRRRPRNRHHRPPIRRRTASRWRWRSPYRQAGREYFFCSRECSHTGTTAVRPACPASRRPGTAFWRPCCRRRPKKQSSRRAAAEPASPGLAGTFRPVQPATSRRRSPPTLGPAPAVSAPTGTTTTAKTDRAARGDSQEKQRRPRQTTAPAETHRRRETGVRRARADRPAPASLRCPGRSPKPLDQADHRSSAARKPIRRLQLVAGPPVSLPETTPKTAVRLHPHQSHKATPAPPTISVVVFGRPQALIRSA